MHRFKPGDRVQKTLNGVNYIGVVIASYPDLQGHIICTVQAALHTFFISDQNLLEEAPLRIVELYDELETVTKRSSGEGASTRFIHTSFIRRT